VSSNSTDSKDIRRFGFIALIFFGGLCGLGAWAGKVVPIYLFGGLGLLGLAFIVAPLPLRPVYAGWLKVAHLVGRVITTLVLVMAYYLVITPSAMLKRLFGGAPLPVRPNKDVLTYWVAREEPAQPNERFLKRY